MSFDQLVFWEVVLAGAVRLATPVALAALGETVVERSGTINLSIEGTMLVGALAGVYGSHQAGWLAGLALGTAVGCCFGLVMAVIVLHGRANQFVAGIALTILGTGLSAYLFQVWVPSGDDVVIAELVPTLEIPGLADVPLLGRMLFDQSFVTYLLVALVVITTWVLRRTGAGLAVTAAGDDPDAATLRGVDVQRVRMLALAFGGAMAGLAGAAITVGYLGSFSEHVTAGRGFVAIATVIIGHWTPWGAVGGALLFAFFDSLALQAQTDPVGLPIELYTALPYAMTLLVLVVTSRRNLAPRALGRPFETPRREQRRRSPTKST